MHGAPDWSTQHKWGLEETYPLDGAACLRIVNLLDQNYEHRFYGLTTFCRKNLGF